ncbi:MAG: septal ring lytic transglycosylase RlpA family protein [Methylococcales bacterium]|nr:septal ring lytic transglycosylase RlpA family protein [Methylococcales bacterium]
MNKKLVALTIILTTGCTIEPSVKDSAPTHVPMDVMAVRDAIPKYEKRTRAGNPGEYKVLGKSYKVLANSYGYREKGLASWYGTKFHGRKTSNGEIYNMYAMTAAHKTLPIPSYVRVTNLNNHRSVVVRINDRGPFHGNRIIDLSYIAAVKLGIQQTGTGSVMVTAFEFGKPEKPENNKDQTAQKNTTAYIQLGAFGRLENAKKLQNKLIFEGIKNSRIQEDKMQATGLYKVQVGPLYSAQQAERASEKLASIGLVEIQLVSEQ